jgi:acyl carrier protein
MEKIKEELREFIAESILFSSNGYQHGDETSFLDHGILDSMSIMDLVLHVETEFNVKIEDQEITPENFDSIEKLAAYIERKKEVVTENQGVIQKP